MLTPCITCALPGQRKACATMRDLACLSTTAERSTRQVGSRTARRRAQANRGGARFHGSMFARVESRCCFLLAGIIGMDAQARMRCGAGPLVRIICAGSARSLAGGGACNHGVPATASGSGPANPSVCPWLARHVDGIAQHILDIQHLDQHQHTGEEWCGQQQTQKSEQCAKYHQRGNRQHRR